MGKISKAMGFPGSTGKDSVDYDGVEEAGNPGDDSAPPSSTGDEFGKDNEKDDGKIGKHHVLAVKAYEKASTPEDKAKAMKDLLEAYGAC